MDVFATLIVTAANVNAARAAQSSASFRCPLSATGEEPATHYASSGCLPTSDLSAVEGLCAVTTGPHLPREAIAAAGLATINQVQN